MAKTTDPDHSQLLESLNFLAESSAKIDYLHSRIENKMRELNEVEKVRLTEGSTIKQEFDGGNDWKRQKDKAEDLQRSLTACRQKCSDVMRGIREIIDQKDTILCQSMFRSAKVQNEILPQGTRIERMIMELKMEKIECTICTENIKKMDPIWSCKNCYNILHLACATACMNATKNNNKWSCPCCRGSLNVKPCLVYTCFCERTVRPGFLQHVTPHGCGLSCKRGCGAVCHPGPCA